MNSWENPKFIEFKIKYPHEDWALIDIFLYAHPQFCFTKIKSLRKQAISWASNKCPYNPGSVITVFDFLDGFRIVRLLDQEAKNWEAFHMRSCVSELKENEGIYSLRDANNIPHCTLEIIHRINNDYTIPELNQIKGTANSAVSPKYIHRVISFLEQLDVTFVELENLGYYELRDEELHLVKTHFKNPIIKYFNNKPYLYIFKNFNFKASYTDYYEKFMQFCLLTKNINGIKHLLKNFKEKNTEPDHYCIFAALLCDDFNLAKSFLNPDDSFSYWRSQVKYYIELGYNQNLDWFMDELIQIFFTCEDEQQFSLMSLLLDCNYFAKFDEQLKKIPPKSLILNKSQGALLWNALIFSAPKELIINLLNKGADLNLLDINIVLTQKYVYPYFPILLPYLKEIPLFKVSKSKPIIKF